VIGAREIFYQLKGVGGREIPAGPLRRICRVHVEAHDVTALGTLVLLLLQETMLLTVTVMFRDILLMLMLIFKEMLGQVRQE
jgi:hypothetical protein